MEFIPNALYHVYNRGNKRERIFYSRENYVYFIRKMRRYLPECCDVLAYCLMPNHFHWIISTRENANSHVISSNIGTLLRSYTRAVNKQNTTSGSLFQQKTKAIPLESEDAGYPLTCFNYIHQNPVKAGLVKRLEDWEYSSFKDYAGLRKGTLCNKDLAYRLLDLPLDPAEFTKLSYLSVDQPSGG